VATLPFTWVDVWPAYVPVKAMTIEFLASADPAVTAATTAMAHAKIVIRNFLTVTPFGT